MTEGERWTRELLAELRAARFAPQAWMLFLSRSFERAAWRRRQQRRAARETLALGAVGLGVWLAVGLAGWPVLSLVGAGWWIGVVLMLDWHLGMLEREDGRPLRSLGAPNVLSLLRMGLVPALPALSPTGLAVALAVAQGVDILDGRLARARDQVTRLGFWLDGSADTLLVGVVAVTLALGGLVGAWLAALVVARAAAPWLFYGIAYFVLARSPRRAGYVSGVVPGALLFAGLVLSALAVPGGPELAAAGAVGGLATFAATVLRSPKAPRGPEHALERVPGRFINRTAV